MGTSVVSFLLRHRRGTTTKGITLKRAVGRLPPDVVARLDEIARRLDGSPLVGGASVSRAMLLRAFCDYGMVALDAELPPSEASP